MPEPVRITVDPDGIPVALVDLAGDQLDGTLWGAARAGGCVALVVTENDALSGQPWGPPTTAHVLALADALTDDPENPHLIEGTRLWWREEATSLRHRHAGAVLRAERAEAEVERLTAMHDAQATVLRHRDAMIRGQRAELDQQRAASQPTAPRTLRRAWWRR